jgi:hypothetical protein
MVTGSHVIVVYGCLLSHTFNYPLPKWFLKIICISGYHKCSKDEASRLAALVYRVRFGESKQELQAIP